MAQQDVEALIKKSVSDDTFRLALNKNFDKTITAHGLTLSAAEKKALKAVDWKKPLPSGGVTAATWIHIYKSDANI